jgi:hypothetical protein
MESELIKARRELDECERQQVCARRSYWAARARTKAALKRFTAAVEADQKERQAVDERGQSGVQL